MVNEWLWAHVQLHFFQFGNLQFYSRNAGPLGWEKNMRLGKGEGGGAVIHHTYKHFLYIKKGEKRLQKEIGRVASKPLLLVCGKREGWRCRLQKLEDQNAFPSTTEVERVYTEKK